MGLYLHTNPTSVRTQFQMSYVTKQLDTVYERLSSGNKINTAQDDPAGVQVVDRLTSQIEGIASGNRNAQDAISYAQTAEGALDEVTSMLQRIRTLALQAANGTNTDTDREAIQVEVDALNAEITRIAEDTTFAGQDILNGEAGVVRFQIGADPNSIVKVDLSSGYSTNSLAKIAAQVTGSEEYELEGEFQTAPDGSPILGPDNKPLPEKVRYEDIFKYDPNGKGIDVSTAESAQRVLAGIDALITGVDAKRAELGAIQNRMESTIRNQSNVSENVSNSRSRIRDTDFAEETANLTQLQIIQQATATVLTQANTRPEVALQILQQR